MTYQTTSENAEPNFFAPDADHLGLDAQSVAAPPPVQPYLPGQEMTAVEKLDALIARREEELWATLEKQRKANERLDAEAASLRRDAERLRQVRDWAVDAAQRWPVNPKDGDQRTHVDGDKETLWTFRTGRGWLLAERVGPPQRCLHGHSVEEGCMECDEDAGAPEAEKEEV